MTKQIEIDQLKLLSPLDSLKKDNLHALVKKTKIKEAQPGETLFREGDSEKRTVYVLTGTVELREADKAVAKITGGTEEARNPLSPKLPRRQTAIATSAVDYVTIDSDLLDVMLTWDQTGSYEVAELRGEGGSSAEPTKCAVRPMLNTRYVVDINSIAPPSTHRLITINNAPIGSVPTSRLATIRRTPSAM
jgi:hypothetical protein